MNDIIFNLLLHADSKTMNNICLTNKYTQSLLTDSYLWLSKFNHHKIPKINLSYEGFVHYEKCHQLTVNVLNLIKEENNYWMIVFDVVKTYPYLPTGLKNKIDNY